MSEKKKIEKLFEEKLSKLEQRPPDGTRDAIEKQLTESGYLKEDKSSGGTILLLLITGLAVLISAGIYFFMPEKKVLTSTPAVVENNLNGDGGTSGVDTLNQKNNQQSIQSDQNDKMESTSGAEGQSDADGFGSASEEKTIAENKSENPTHTVNNNIPAGKQTSGNEKQKPETTPVSGAAVSDKKIPVENQPRPDKTKAVVPGIAITTSGISEPPSNPTEKDATNKDNTLENSEKVSADSSAVAATNSIQPAINTTDTLPASEKAKPDTTNKLVSQPVSQPDSTTATQKQNQFHYGVEAFAGPLWNTSAYQGNDASMQSFADSSKDAEKEDLSVIAGLNLIMAFKNFLAATGLDYASMKSTLSYSQSQFAIDTSNSHYNYVDTTVIIIDSTGIDTITYHIDSTWITVSDTSVSNQNFNKSNKISIIEIPFLIGYRFNAGKFDIELMGGASISFIRSINTNLLSGDSTLVTTYNDVNNSPYRKSYWSVLGSANMLYNLNDRYSLFFRPAFKLGLSGIYKNDYPVSKKISGYSLQLGIRMNL